MHVYVCNILSIEHVYRHLRVTLLSLFDDGRLHVSFLRPSSPYVYLVIPFRAQNMSDLFLGTLGYCPFHHSIYWWFDLSPCFDMSLSILLHVSFCFLLPSLVLLFYLIFLSPCSSLTLIHISDLIFSSYHSYIFCWSFDVSSFSSSH